MNRVVLDGIHTDDLRATRLERPGLDPVRPVVFAMIRALALVLLILLLIFGKRKRRPQRGQFGASPRGVVSEALFRKVATGGVVSDVP